jgi:hypothetical protein
MTRIVLLAAAALFALPAFAFRPADALVGTWECRVPGAPPTKTPPIVWFGPTVAGGYVAPTTVDLDGFARTVSGLSDIVPAPDGWWQIQPESGAAFSVQPLGSRGSTLAMTLRRGNSSYNCLRLPLYGV